MTESARLMAVHAHPDDESSKGAATMAKYTAAGHRVRVVSCTGGERGDVLNPHLADDPAVIADLPAYRRREMALAAEALGIEHEWLGFVDSGLPEGDPLPPLPPGCFALTSDEDAVGALVRSIREFRPHVMTTYNENGGYPHPDHLRCHAISVAAYEAAADPEQFPEAGPAWSVSKLYYDVSFTRSRMVAIGEHMAARGLVSPFDEWLAERGDRPEREVTTRIECGQFFGRRDDALRAHATQIDPDGFFFAVPRDVEREAWPYEEFELARTRVGRPQGLETDLFDGIEIGDEQ